MKKLRNTLLGLFFVGAIALTSCSKDTSDDPAPVYPSNPIELPEVNPPIDPDINPLS